MKSGKVEIRIVSKAKNAILARLADKLGGVEKAADKIGVNRSTYSSWLNFRNSPITGRYGLKQYGPKKAAILEALEQLAGASVEDIFPLTKSQCEFIASTRIVDRTIECAQITSQVESKYLSYDPRDNIDLEIDRLAAADAIRKQLNTLSYRERKIIELRYGLSGDGKVYTLEEVGHIFKVCRERIRAIEGRAIRKLQAPLRSSGLIEYLESVER